MCWYQSEGLEEDEAGGEELDGGYLGWVPLAQLEDDHAPAEPVPGGQHRVQPRGPHRAQPGQRSVKTTSPGHEVLLGRDGHLHILLVVDTEITVSTGHLTRLL